MSALLDHLSTAVVALDGELRFTRLNAAAEELFSVSGRQLEGKALTDYLVADQPFVNNLRRLLETQRSYVSYGSDLLLTYGRTMIVDYRLTSLNEAQAGARVVAELARVEQMQQLAQAGQLMEQHATNRAVLRGLAHEIKNPLGGLRGAAQLLERELPKRALREYTRIIIHEADRLQKLVDRMTAAPTMLRREPVNVHEVLEHVRRLMLVEFPNGLGLRPDYDPSLPECRGDSEQLTQAFLNLVRNAAQAVANTGNIVLRTRAERQFTIGPVRHRLVLRIDVEDDGPGIAEDLRGRVFLPMVSDKDEGTGLGLPIAQEIVQRHGGLISCRSRPGRTVFTTYLPVGPGQ